MNVAETGVVLEPEAEELVRATALPPYLFQLAPEDGRKALEDLQSGDVPVPVVEVVDTVVPVGPEGAVSVRTFRPPNRDEALPAILYIHGAGWVFGSTHTHDRLVRELCAATDSVVVFPSYDLAPDVRYPTAIEQNYAVLCWLAEHGTELGVDVSRIAVAGDSVGGNMAAAMTLMAKERSGPQLAAQLLYYPVTDSNFDTASYREFGEGYYLRRDGMQWFWDQYTTDPAQRAEITASPLRASLDDLAGLPTALVVVGEADVLRDEGEAYAAKLRQAGVPTTAVRYQGIVHDFVMLNSMRDTHAARAATRQGAEFLYDALHA